MLRISSLKNPFWRTGFFSRFRNDDKSCFADAAGEVETEWTDKGKIAGKYLSFGAKRSAVKSHHHVRALRLRAGVKARELFFLEASFFSSNHKEPDQYDE